MSVPAKSLNTRVPHERLLDLLDCKVRTQGLPLKTRCPVCKEGVLTDGLCRPCLWRRLALVPRMRQYGRPDRVGRQNVAAFDLRDSRLTESERHRFARRRSRNQAVQIISRRVPGAAP